MLPQQTAKTYILASILNFTTYRVSTNFRTPTPAAPLKPPKPTTSKQEAARAQADAVQAGAATGPSRRSLYMSSPSRSSPRKHSPNSPIQKRELSMSGVINDMDEFNIIMMLLLATLVTAVGSVDGRRIRKSLLSRATTSKRTSTLQMNPSNDRFG